MGANESRIQKGRRRHGQVLIPSSTKKGSQLNESNMADDCTCFNPFAIFDACRKNSGERKYRRNNPLGTPLPDTPQALRRRRIEALNGYNYKHGNYDFLDLESSKREGQVYLDLRRSHSGSVTTSKITTSTKNSIRMNDEQSLEQNTFKDRIANIHDGKVCDEK